MKRKKRTLIGRDAELGALTALKEKRSASLVVLWGRRRIGKSTLAEEFGRTFPRFFKFQGLGPRPAQTNRHQLDYFAETLQGYFPLPEIRLRTWTEALNLLATQCRTGPVCILLDEISWLGGKDKDFAGKLKAVWDNQLKNNPELILIVCGSVSAWIKKNILFRTDFVGRVSLSIQVQELSMAYANQFWGQVPINIGSNEKLKALLLTGGVPKYLEEIAVKTPIATQFRQKCFSKDGFFLQEFERVFSDIFGRRSKVHREVLAALSTKTMTAAEIARSLDRPLNGKLTEILDNLTVSGFLSRDQVFLPDGKPADRVFYRVKDNYVRFYLRLIAPRLKAIEQGGLTVSHVEDLPNWHVFMGQQFENLIYLCLPQIYSILNINTDRIASAGPYLQKKSARIKTGCQVDLFVHVRESQYYVCEIKSGILESGLIPAMRAKIAAIKFPTAASVRPVLICAQISEAERRNLEPYFFKIITFEDLLQYPVV
jgi:AAA+ ATPase superfamily predicted ATPase